MFDHTVANVTLNRAFQYSTLGQLPISGSQNRRFVFESWVNFDNLAFFIVICFIFRYAACDWHYHGLSLFDLSILSQVIDAFAYIFLISLSRNFRLLILTMSHMATCKKLLISFSHDLTSKSALRQLADSRINQYTMRL
jgi:hypothetical protein